MTDITKTTIVSVVTRDPRRLLAAAAGLAIVAALGGVLIDRSTGDRQEVKVTAEAGGEKAPEAAARKGFVVMAPDAAAAAGIVTEVAAPGTIANEVLAQATVTAPPEGQAALTAPADGRVVRIGKRLGDPVSPGEVIALMESRDAAGMASERSKAAARATAARAAYNRERRLFEAKITARQDLEGAQATFAEAEAELSRASAALRAAGVTGDGRHVAIRSLVGGRIAEVNTQLGAYALAGAQLFRVVNPRSVQIEASLPAAEVQRVNVGDPAVIELPGGGTVAAVVRSVTPSLNVESRAATVVLAPSGVPVGLSQGQGLRVRITPRGASAGGRISLPEEAVQSVDGRDVVFVQQQGGFQAVPVTVGNRSGGRLEIVAGLPAAARVVTRGAFLLKSQLGAGAAEHD